MMPIVSKAGKKRIKNGTFNRLKIKKAASIETTFFVLMIAC
jgi:hypothetical protein